MYTEKYTCSCVRFWQRQTIDEKQSINKRVFLCMFGWQQHDGAPTCRMSACPTFAFCCGVLGSLLQLCGAKMCVVYASLAFM